MCVFQNYSESAVSTRLMWLISCNSLMWFIIGAWEFLHAIQDWEGESLSNFMDVIYGVSLRAIGEDKKCWMPAKSRGFEVSSYHWALLGVCNRSVPWRSIWKPKVPSKVMLFIWTAALGNILTTDNLCKRKVRIQNWCYMYKRNGESVDNLLLNCPIVFELWSTVFNLFGIILGNAKDSG